MDARERWRRLPSWGRFLALFVALLALPALVGRLTPLGAGNAVFIAGAAMIFASLAHIRLGGPRTIVDRDLDGRPVWGLDAKKRGQEIRRGLSWFALGVALWGVLLVAWLARG